MPPAERLLTVAPVALFGAAAGLGALLVARALSQPAPAWSLAPVMGSLAIVSTALPLAAALGVGTGVYLAEYAADRASAGPVRRLLAALHRLPSVVLGLAGWVALAAVPVSPGVMASLVLGVLALPTIVFTTEVAVRSVPAARREAAVALGATRFQVVTRLLLPAAAGGVVLGATRAGVRIVGEAAPLLVLGLVHTVPTQVYLSWVSGPSPDVWWLAIGLVVLAFIGTGTATDRPEEWIP